MFRFLPYLIIFFATILIGQILPTVPGNVFRINIKTNLDKNINQNSKWVIGKQDFNLDKAGLNYFNNLVHNDSVRFAYPYDLYFNGSVYLDPNLNDTIIGKITVEDWIINFNSKNSLNLPTFGRYGIDTNQVVEIPGSFYQQKKKLASYTNINMEYGMSDRITLSLNIPIINEHKITNIIDSVQIDKASNVNGLIEYHNIAKNQFNTFLSSNTFSEFPGRLRDTLETIYNYFYSDNGQYSVNWAFHAKDDPYNNKLIDKRFFLIKSANDSIDIDSLISYYYPKTKFGIENKNKTTFDDITIGTTILLRGKPNWSDDTSLETLYGQFFVSIPFGPTLKSFLSNREKQFNDAKVGSGVTRFSFGLYGRKKFKKYNRVGMYFQTLLISSTPEILNTPVSMFSGGHSHPDSILNSVGSTYRFDKGSEFYFKFGNEVVIRKNKLLLQNDLSYSNKLEDGFLSNDKNWDMWMKRHMNYSSSFASLDFNTQLWLINSYSYNRFKFLPLSFDAYLSYKKTMYAKNTYKGSMFNIGLTYYYQGW